jgi:flagellar biosynthesis protein FlhF
MPLETYTGRSVTRLLARARAELGADAVIVRVSRSSLSESTTGFTLTAADAGSALRLDTAATIVPPETDESPRLAGKLTRGEQRQVIAVVGPTGSGKTTTIAKLALHPDMFAGRKVGLLCLDTYKVGGVEQLENFASIARLPLEVAYSTSQLSRAMRRLRKREVVLVDTSGTSPRSAADVAAFDALLRQLAPDEVHLTLPAGLHREYVRHLVGEYAAHRITHVLRTKLDEYPRDTGAAAAAAEQGLPIRWVTCGQGVPHDVKLVDDPQAVDAVQQPHGLETGANVA